nr:ATP-dependent Clp protease adaptor ClpS [Saccharopolyspora pogona]
MPKTRTWRVDIHNDDVTSMLVVVHVLHRLCGLSLADAGELAAHAHQHGAAAVREFADQATAEALAVGLQRHGLRTTIRKARNRVEQHREDPEPVLTVDDEDFFEARSTSDGVVVQMSGNVAETLAHHAEQLIHLLGSGVAEPARAGVLRRAASADLLGRMFPDTYRERAESAAFRQRHRAALQGTAAARRVHARCVGGTEHVLPRGDVTDWLTTFGLAKLMSLPREYARFKPADPGLAGAWLTHVQEKLILAAEPGYTTPRALG